MKLNFKISGIKSKKNYKKGSLVINPQFFWNVVLGVILMMVVTAFVYGFLLFRKVNKEFISSDVEINLQAGILKRDRLNKALEYFKTRELKSNEIKSSPAPIIDPSL